MAEPDGLGLDAAQVAQATASYDAVRLAGGALWWLESVPAEGGRAALMRTDVTGGSVCEVTPPSADVGSDMHAYGGGAYSVGDSYAWFVDSRDGLIHRTDDLDGTGVAIDDCLSYGDLTPNHDHLFAVGETAEGDHLLLVGQDRTSGRVIASTDGYFAAPRPSGDRLAWLQWPRDRMPWDATELWVADLHSGALAGALLVAGGSDEAVLEPQWSDVYGLTFLSDRGGWWNLYAWDGATVRAVVTVDADIAAAPWELGYASYVHLSGGRIAMTVHDGPRQRLVVHHPDGRRDEVSLPFTAIKPYLATDGDRVFCIASSPTDLPQVVAVDLASGGWQRLSREQPAGWAGPNPATPAQITVDGPAGPLNALLYAPHGAPQNWSAPLIVRAHPGPTASMTLRPDPQVQFLCSHGFAVVDVDYRGSTGYTRRFRQALNGQWGTADVDDCIAAVEHLIRCGRATAGEVFITGASAGGYTALQAVSRFDVFAGAVARSAIIDPARWQQTAPRWQRPHAAALAGPAGAVRAEAIQRPVLLIHGQDDHVASFADVAELADALKAQEKPHDLLVLGTAGHEFGARDDTARALDAELAFYRDRLAAVAGT